MSRFVPSLVQVSGFAAVTVGCSLVSAVLGWLAAGVSLIVAGVALERGNA